jgi:predicted acetyltransferase
MRLIPASNVPPAGLRDLLGELGNGESGFSGTAFGRGEATLEEYLRMCCDGPDPTKLKLGLVPQTVYWLLDESGTAVGIVRVRHCLNERLLQHGGNIGFFVRAAYRGRGYGKLALRLALDELRKLGEKRALLTVNEGNTPSIRAIQSCGGQLENVISDSDGKTRTMRFWVDLDLP